LERARSSGTVEVAQPVTVRGLLYNSGRVVGVRLDDHGHEYEAHSRIVIGADGRHSLVAREVGAPVERAVEPLRTLYYRYVSGWRGPDGASPDAAEFSLNGDEMAYVFPSDGAVACVGLSAHRDAFSAFRSAPQSELDRRLRAHAGLATRLEATVPVGRVAGGPPEANWVRTPTGPGWALIGDAAVHQDPWTGEGMDNAGMAAMFMAEAIADWLGGGVTEDEAFAHYRALRDEHVLASFDECTTVGRDLRQLAAGSASGS
jgi:flavin-dependent dehydrogenase